MSLIARQDALVAQLQPVHAKRLAGYLGGWWGATRSRIKRKHIEEMLAVGYSRREAADSAQQCDDMAALNAGHEMFAETMGAVS